MDIHTNILDNIQVCLIQKLYLLVFHRKDLCEARVKPKMSSNFQMMFSDIPPTQNCQCQKERSLLIYVVNESPFEAYGRIMSSFQMKCSDIPLQNLSDEVTKIRCEMKYPDKLSDISPQC